MNLVQLRRRAFEQPEQGSRWLDLAFALDGRGREAEAIPAYVQALHLGVPPEDRRIALLCLASSYRETGQFRRALSTVETARREHPDDAAVDSFHALILLDSDEPRRAVRMLGLALLREADVKAFGGFENALTRKFRSVTQGGGRRRE
jgi:Flp pilus assembly protein TadD